MSVGEGEGTGIFSAIDAVLAARIYWTTALTTALMSTLGVDVRGGADGAWVSGTVGSEADKASWADMTSDAYYHDCRGDCLRESDRDVMLAGMWILQGSWI